MLSYQINRSNRKTISASFDDNGNLFVKAPLNTSKQAIDLFLEQKSVALWHLKQRICRKIFLKKSTLSAPLVKMQASQKILARFDVMHQHGKHLGLETHHRPVLKVMTSRWGSCKKNGLICLNLFLGLLAEPLIDSVIAHELCHLKEMNHSQRFYKLLQELYPDYKNCDALLRQYSLKKDV